MMLILSRVRLCNPMSCCPPGSSVCGIFQARILEWVAVSSSRGSFRPRDWTHVACVAGSFFTCWAILENSLVIQLLGLQASTAWGQVQSLVGDRRSWKPHSMAKKKKNNKKKKACLWWMQNFKNYAHQYLNFNFHMSQNIIFLLIF